jgi:hypothetical protein
MALLRRRTDDAPHRPDLLRDIEQFLKRAVAIPLVAPVLLFMGFGVGKVTTRAIQLPAGAEVREHGDVPDVPRFKLETLSRSMRSLRQDGENTVNYVSLYRDHVAPVEQVLRKRGVPHSTARKVAWPLVEHAYRRGLSPATVTSVLLIESEGKPTARSPVGAMGLMQVMPFWSGRWRGCGKNLYEIEDNLCNGTSILAWYIRNAKGDERRALLGYNGCVRGTNTPNCFIYPDKIWKLRMQIDRELRASRQNAQTTVTEGP